jgi:hypothetical protein
MDTFTARVSVFNSGEGNILIPACAGIAARPAPIAAMDKRGRPQSFSANLGLRKLLVHTPLLGLHQVLRVNNEVDFMPK